MIDPTISQSELGRRISTFSLRARDGRQVSNRLKQLLPTRLKNLKNKYQKSGSAGQALRRALTDKDYTEHLNEFVSVRSNSLEARVSYETHIMLQDARASIRAWHRSN